MIGTDGLRLVERYLDGDLDAEGADRLLAALADPEQGDEIRRRIGLAGQLTVALEDQPGAGIAAAVLARLDAPAAAPQRRRAPPRRWRWPVAAVFAAGCAAAILITWRLATPPGDPGPQVVAAGGVVSGLVRDGRRIALTAGSDLRAGDLLVADAPVSMRLDEASRLDLAPGTRLRLLPPDGGERLRLEAGAIAADIAPQPRPLVIATPDARAEILGTRFHLAVRDGRSHLEVYAGSVRLSSAGGSWVVDAGGAAASDGGDAGAWRPLFPGGALDAWQLRDGAWSVTAGIVRGEATAAAPARIQSVGDFGDLELHCRMRITGANRGEVQLGGYNWFFAIPAGSRDRDGWVSLLLTQRGGSATCLADGTAVALEIAGQPDPRSGPLAFYAPLGAVIEIADARIRTPR